MKSVWTMGEMIVEIFPSSQLGSKDNIIDQAMAGDCVITLANGAFFQDRGVKDFGVVFAPYLFESWEQLDKLAASGHLHKINTAEGAFYHLCAHTEDSHRDCFLLKCSRCGRIRHLDCSHLHSLYQHLEQEHHFRIDPRRTVLTGRCDRCADAGACAVRRLPW